MPAESNRDQEREKRNIAKARHHTMAAEEISHWDKTIDNAEHIRADDHTLWRRLLNAYRLEIETDMENPRKISRFYPLTRQLIASIAFNNPHVLMRVEDNNLQFATEKLQRFANDLLVTIDAKRHVQQQIFDALYCCIGWLKCGVNPPGDEDLVPPYVANDGMQNGLFYVTRVSPFNVLVDPLTPPHDISQASFIIEKMIVPTEFVKKDKRFINTDSLKPLKESTEVDQMVGEELEGGAGDHTEGGSREGLFEDAKRLRGMTILYQIHDRLNKRQITFARGNQNKKPIQNIAAPFLAGRVETRPDPVDPERQLVVPNSFTPTGGYLVRNGTPFISLKFDPTPDHIYGLPMMAYAEDTQKGVVESVTRRANLLKRLTMLIMGNRSEKEENEEVADRLERGEEGGIVWVNDVNNAFRGIDFGSIPADQLGIESDYRNYEDQILQTSQIINSGQRTLTATQSALSASFGQLNREWLQQPVVQVYRDIVHNGIRISGDLRYTPRNFIVNVSDSDQDPVYEAITADLLQARFKVNVEAASLSPMFEEMEREDGLALFQYLIQMPEIPRIESIKHLLRTFRVPNMERFLKRSNNPEIRAAQLENQWMAMRGENPGVLPDQEHEVHVQTHQQIGQDPVITQLLEQNPNLLARLQQAMQQHMQEHQQHLQTKAQGQGMPSPANINGLGRDGSTSPAGAVNDIVGRTVNAVRAGAQNVSQDAAVINRNQN